MLHNTQTIFFFIFNIEKTTKLLARQQEARLPNLNTHTQLEAT